MENNITTTPAAEGKKQQNAVRNPIARFFSAANKKRKRIALSITTAITMSMVSAVTAMVSAVTAFADGDGGGGLGKAGEDEFNKLIEFFALWIGRIGMVVAFVGGIMFGLAVKNEDSEAKTRGLMTMVSGFIVYALTKSLNLFGLGVPIF